MQEDTLKYLSSLVDGYRRSKCNRFSSLLVNRNIIDELIDLDLITEYGNILGDVLFTETMLQKVNQ